MEIAPLTINLVDIDSPPKEQKPSLYSQWCMYLLRSEFRRVRTSEIRSALKRHKGRLIPAYMAIALAHSNAMRKEQKNPPDDDLRKTVRTEKCQPYTGLKLKKVPRSNPRNKPNLPCPLFNRDLGFLKIELENSSFLMMSKLDLDYGENTSPIVMSIIDSNNVECGCCCNEMPFEEMVQCADGHLFCFVCLRRRVEDLTYGGLPAFSPLLCIDMSECDKSIPLSEIKRAIQADLLVKFEERQASDCVARAKIQGLAYCPSCNFACEVDETISVLKCPQPSCRKESCINCKEPAHLPLRCEEVEKPFDTRNRNEIEEIMSRSVIRQCVSCKAELLKDDGCNKITCRCGQSMCYVCRKAITNYSHFCEHVRSPGKSCTICKKCGLWEKEDENAVVIKAKRKALESKAGENVSLIDREIGPNDTFFKKRKA